VYTKWRGEKKLLENKSRDAFSGNSGWGDSDPGKQPALDGLAGCVTGFHLAVEVAADPAIWIDVDHDRGILARSQPLDLKYYVVILECGVLDVQIVQLFQRCVHVFLNS